MATIKTQANGGIKRIVTKVVNGQRRVSCSCWGAEGCCMYAADAYGVLFGEDDLPDEVKVEGIIYTKVDSPYTITAETESFEVYYEGRLLQDPEVQEFIAIANFAPSQWTQGTVLAFTSFDCLITEFSLIKDTFEDTYTITTPYSSGTVSRIGLCEWQGTDQFGCVIGILYFGYPEAVDATGSIAYKWGVYFAEYDPPFGCSTGLGAIKQGNQNTPVGTHTDIVAGVSVTVA
jgi:hypothetical protein